MNGKMNEKKGQLKALRPLTGLFELTMICLKDLS